jgi:asparagine synthase (glutamine-hydrolysing)
VLSFEEAVREFASRMADAVRRQLIADVPVGVFLSGGIDSTIVAAIAAESRSSIDTFSIGFEEKSFDESPWASEVAARIGSRHHSEKLTAGRMLELVPHAAAITSEPVADGSIFPTYLLCAFARRSVKVALSGDGADELFGGYPTHGLHRAGRAMSLLPPIARRSLARVADHVLPVSYDNLTYGFKARKFLNGLHRDPLVRNQRWLGSFAHEELATLLVESDTNSQQQLERLLTSPVAGDARERILRSDERFYLADQVLVKADRASMANSLEVRVPFLDDVVTSFARSLPFEYKVRRGAHKLLLREYLRGRFSEALVARPKKGFGAPLGHWFRNELRGLLGDTLSPAVLRRQNVFRPEPVQRLLAEHWSGRADHRKKLFNVLTFTLWFDYAKQQESRGQRTRADEASAR